MGNSIADAALSRHRLLDEMPSPVMAKASSRKLNSDFQAEIGRSIARARLLVGWSKKELAGKLDKDEAQISRWEAGKERPQFDQLWSVPEMRTALVIALAEMAEGIDVTTHISIRRTA